MNAALKYDIATINAKELAISRKISEDVRNDPFDLGTTVRELTHVNHQRNLSNYAEELVSQYSKYKYDHYELLLSDLPESEQNELASNYIESIDREIEWACYGSDESINSDYLCALLSMLKDNCEENREKFAEVTQKNILIYYKNSLQEVLDDACHNYLHNSMNEQGYYSHRDLEHGDLVWRA